AARLSWYCGRDPLKLSVGRLQESATHKNSGLRIPHSPLLLFHGSSCTWSELEHVGQVAAYLVSCIQGLQPERALDEPQYRNVIHLHVRDVIFLCKWRDHQHRHPGAEALGINLRWRNMVPPAPARIPDYDDRAIRPDWACLNLLN